MTLMNLCLKAESHFPRITTGPKMKYPQTIDFGYSIFTYYTAFILVNAYGWKCDR